MSAKQAMKENLQCTSKYGHLRISQDICHVRMTDIEGFLTIYGHSDNLLNNNGGSAAISSDLRAAEVQEIGLGPRGITFPRPIPLAGSQIAVTSVNIPRDTVYPRNGDMCIPRTLTEAENQFITYDWKMLHGRKVFLVYAANRYFVS